MNYYDFEDTALSDAELMAQIAEFFQENYSTDPSAYHVKQILAEWVEMKVAKKEELEMDDIAMIDFAFDNMGVYELEGLMTPTKLQAIN